MVDGPVAEQTGLSFGGLLRQLRDEAGLTQDELAEAAQVSQRAISDLERGINRTARKDTAILLAGALGLDGPARELFIAAARGRAPAGEALAAAAREAGTRSATASRTFLFTDIEGSTALLGRLGEDLYAQVLAGHHALIRSALAAHDGREVDTQGDAFFAVFSSLRGCVAAVLQMQQALQDHAWPGGERVRVRMGIHCGEAARTAAGLVGLEVHRAARVAAVGHGGQVLVSESAAVLVRDGLPPGAALADLGVHRLKDLGRPERIFQLHAAGLPAEFPPLRSLGNPALPNNLPAQLSAFIGRDREVAEVRGLVESSRLVTLTGAGGCGKTRLGLQVAAELLDGSGDGVWLVELAAVTDQDAVAAAVCEALRLAARPGRPALEALLDALALQDVLIVVDNCEHLIGGCAKTAEAIVQRCPRVHLLATSREPLGIGGETIYRVPSLSLPGPEDSDFAPGSSDAVALFAERARAHGVGLPVEEQAGPLVVSVCRRLDGMPLAIELAAARLRSMSLAELHGRLDQRFRLLTGGSRTALERQQTLRAAVAWSYSLLAGAEQVLLGRLSVFAGSFDLAAAEAVCGFGGIDVLEVAALLGSLVDKSLVVAEPAGEGLRYRLLETIRLFAAERLVEVGEDEAAAVAEAHCAHFLSVAETAAAHLTGPEQGRRLARLDADQANLRRAAQYAADRPDGTALVLRLGVALDRYWRARSREQEAFRLLVPALQRPGAGA
ncbi:MAG: adenylate/guanylate cyclase domain-containing protein, partial [Streptosporangiaceae bacterium]